MFASCGSGLLETCGRCTLINSLPYCTGLMALMLMGGNDKIEEQGLLRDVPSRTRRAARCQVQPRSSHHLQGGPRRRHRSWRRCKSLSATWETQASGGPPASARAMSTASASWTFASSTPTATLVLCCLLLLQMLTDNKRHLASQICNVVDRRSLN